METFDLKEDQKVMYVTADSFPAGIEAAFNKLYSMAEGKAGRTIFGLTKPNAQRMIEYRAAVRESFEGEAEKVGLPTYIITKGTYQVVKIQDYMKNIPAIGAAFMQLLQSPTMDPNGWCVEAYRSPTEVWCMVRQKN